MTVELTLPTYVKSRPIRQGGISYHWAPPTKDKKRAAERGEPFPFHSVKLGDNLSQTELDDLAKPHNDLLKAWRDDRHTVGEAAPVYGTIKWLLRKYQVERVFTERVAERSRGDYRNIFEKVIGHETPKSKKYDSLGEMTVSSLSPRAAQIIYDAHAERGALRSAEKVQEFCQVAWARMQPLYPKLFRYENGVFINPWKSVARKKRRRKIKPMVDHETVYKFAWAAIEAGRPECGAAAVICFEWLQRPENAVEGHITWTDYRPKDAPGKIRILHHKTGEFVYHPLDHIDPETGETVRLYPEAEEILSHLPKRGVSMILGPKGQSYKANRFWQICQTVAKGAGIGFFNLDACRHGGMTELEEAELTEGQGRALSAHKTSRNYRRYAKVTERRVLGATLKRRAHTLAEK